MPFKLHTATLLVEKTMPCILKKLTVWFLVCFAFLAATLAGAGFGLIIYAFDIQSGVLATFMATVGLLTCSYVLLKLRGSIFVPLRAGHLRVMGEQLKQRKTIARKIQIEHANNTVKKYFGSVEELAQLERNIRKVLSLFYSRKITEKFPIAENAFLQKLLLLKCNILSAFLAEPVLAYAIGKENKAPKQNCKLALAFLLQNNKQYFGSFLFLIAFMYLSWLFFVFVMLFPINWLTGMLPFSTGLWNIVFAMIFAWAIKATIIESIAVSSMLPVFLELIDSESPNDDVNRLIDSLSEGFFKSP